MSLTNYILRCRKQAALVLFWITVNSLCLLGNGLANAQALTSLVTLDVQTFLFWCGIQLAVNLIWILQINYITPAKEKAIQDMDQLMRSDITRRLAQVDLAQFRKQSQEAYTSWLTYDIETINDMGFEVLELMLSQAFNILLGIVTLVTYHPSFLLTLTIFAGLMALAPKLFSATLNQRALAFTQKNEALIQEIHNRLGGFRLLLNANRLDHLETKILDSADNYAHSKIAYAKTFGNMMATQNGVSFISQIAIIAQAGFLYSLKLVPLGSVTSAPYFASIVFPSLTGFFANYAELKNCRLIFDKWQSLELSKDAAPQRAQFNQTLSLRDVKVSWNDQTCLSLPDLTIARGHKLAIIGPSGSGKSSLLAALLKEKNLQSGQILLDHWDYDELQRTSLQDLISIVPQEAYLFEDSLRYNLTLGVSIADQIINSVLEKLELMDWFNQQEDGLNSWIHPKTLSGGQAQRLCLARAILANKPILLLDEATSALEPNLRQKIENTLLTMNKTLVIITHHLSPETRAQCDQVVAFPASTH
ncbi:ATP-binding cassette domain-containing protein [Streptococcus ovuberis]|uniref:ABC transporter ATP-binding protein n=1 Tax=Streptococcus ovuberis TaxID=1936207 RepID=A0A7X6S0H2_9STRE|nr:ABC transporter ATP-binding protein [Streptococcus ovuberis]NKZ19772.1 ABC transporter ATP-binding protein [Streptococcus ovuberis]